MNMQHDHVLEKLNFDLLTPSPGSGGGGRGLRTKYLLPCCFILWFSLNWYAIWPCSEKVEFWPISPLPRVEAVCGQSICYLAAAFVIFFNLICSMTIFWKKMTLDLPDPIPMTWCPKISAWCVNMKHYTDDPHGDYIFGVSSLNLYYV